MVPNSLQASVCDEQLMSIGGENALSGNRNTRTNIKNMDSEEMKQHLARGRTKLLPSRPFPIAYARKRSTVTDARSFRFRRSFPRSSKRATSFKREMHNFPTPFIRFKRYGRVSEKFFHVNFNKTASTTLQEHTNSISWPRNTPLKTKHYHKATSWMLHKYKL